MKFKIQCKDVDGGEPWWEEYEKDITDPIKWGKGIVVFFNDTLRPGEKKREFISAEIIGDEESAELHSWDKSIVGMSSNFRGRIVDMMYCTKCGITGKRFGLKSNIVIDSKYKKKVFQKCNTAIEELKS